MVETRVLAVPRQPRKARVQVAERNGVQMYYQIPDIVVDFIAWRYQRGGWEVRREGPVLVMDTILKHYRFIEGATPREAYVYEWPRMAGFNEEAYTVTPPLHRYALTR